MQRVPRSSLAATNERSCGFPATMITLRVGTLLPYFATILCCVFYCLIPVIPYSSLSREATSCGDVIICETMSRSAFLGEKRPSLFLRLLAFVLFKYRVVCL